MSNYINPGNSYFAAKTGRIPFVDKTEMIVDLNNIFGPDGEGRVCVSRPRRFGKTMAANMIAAYYDCSCDSRALFEYLKVAQTPGWDKWLNKCNVVKIDLSEFYSNARVKADVIKNIEEALVKELTVKFPNARINEGASLPKALSNAFEVDGHPFVFILDEYDALVRYDVPKAVFERYLDLLNGLFKEDSMNEVIQLAYITGIMPIVKDVFESKLNNFTEYSILKPGGWGKYIGFTKDEVKQVCDEAGIDYKTCLDWYDGYNLGKGIDIASPYSVTEAAKRKEFEGHWSGTGIFSKLKDIIEMDLEGLHSDAVRLFNGDHISIKVNNFPNIPTELYSKDDVFTYLVHLGYLAYNNETKQACVPNREVMEVWEFAVKDNPKFKPILDLAQSSRRLLQATIGRDAKTVADLLNRAHRVLTSSFSYNNEQSLQSAIILAYYAARKEYNIFTELPAGDGFADVAFIPVVPAPERPAMIIELKWNKDTDVALDQIREKRYADALSNYKGNIICAAITYNTRTKKHVCEFDTIEV